MLNVVRSVHGYADYKSKTTREIVKQDFGRICYLCEGDPVQNWEIDHFYPVLHFSALENDMDNLFFICSKCNKIRPKDINTTGKEVLNPCIDNVEELISLSMDISDSNKVITIQNNDNANPKVQTTKTLLLEKIYNGIDTSSNSFKDLQDDIFATLVELRENLLDYLENKKGTFLEDNWQRKEWGKINSKPCIYYSFKQALIQELEFTV